MGSIKLEILESNEVAPARSIPRTAPSLFERDGKPGWTNVYFPDLISPVAVEVVIATRDTEAARDRWQRLFDPLQPARPLTWRPAVGPAITLVEGGGERVEHLALAVRSAEVAHRVWRELAEPTLGRFPLRFVAG